jgi:hypothetical protein
MSLVKTSLPLMLAVSLGMVACNDPPGPATSSALQAASSKTTGSTSDPAATSTCKESTDASGVPCKICVDSSGSISYDDCGSGGTGGVGGTSGSGAGGSGATDVKCAPTTDPTTGAACKTCYAADGTITSNSCSTDRAGGSGAGGSGATDVKCAPTTDPTTGATCQTCYAADGTITSNSCSTAGTGASCVGAPNIETGQICKVCSDTVSGKLLFVDCGPPACPSPASTPTSPPPTK